MILVNDKQVEFTKFPDGTTSFRFSPHLPPDVCSTNGIAHFQYHMEIRQR